MIYHRYLQYKGKNLFWLDSDSEQHFNGNIHRLEHWQNDPITYSFNSKGFRDSEFPQKIEYLAMGCSHTFGLGLRLEQTWVSQLSKKLDKKIYNAGVSSASMDTVYRLLDALLGYHEVKHLLLLCPPSYRFDCCTKDNFEWTNYNFHSENNEDYVKNYFINDINSAINFEKNLRAIKQLCLEKNIKVVYLNNDHDHEPIADQKARDLMHSGPEVHLQLAKKFEKLL